MSTPAAGPWTKYAQEQGPWTKYAQTDNPMVNEDTGKLIDLNEPYTAGKVLTGAARGLGHTVAGVASLVNKIPGVGETLAPQQGVTALKNLSTPRNNPEKLGYYGEQAGEWLAPGPAEEKAGLVLAEHAPQLGRLAAPIGRLAAGTLASGTLNKIQGGDFKTGAELGASAGAAGEIGRAVAPSIAESALGINKRMRGFGKTPGEAILAETRGITPGTIAHSAKDKLIDLTDALQDMASRSSVPTTQAPAVQVIDREMAKAVRQNNKTLYDGLKSVRDQLTTNFITGQPLPQQLTASQLLDLKRGIGDLEGNWNPDLKGKLKGTVRRVYGELDKELDRAVPEGKELNQKISSLIPAKERAESTEREAGFSQRALHRVAAHTGALTSAAASGYIGREKYGTPGMVGGAALGLLVPEMIASPEAQMILGRSLRSGVPARLGRAAVGTAMGAGRDNQ